MAPEPVVRKILAVPCMGASSIGVGPASKRRKVLTETPALEVALLPAI